MLRAMFEGIFERLALTDPELAEACRDSVFARLDAEEERLREVVTLGTMYEVGT